MTQLARLKAQVTDDLRESLRRTGEAGEVPSVEGPEVVWEYPSEPGFGDLATPVAFALARSAAACPGTLQSCCGATSTWIRNS